MIIQMVDNTIDMEKKTEYIAAAKSFAEDASANDKGCLGMSVLADAEHEEHVFIVSKWETKEDMNGAQAFMRHKSELKPAFRGNVTTILETI